MGTSYSRQGNRSINKLNGRRDKIKRKLNVFLTIRLNAILTPYNYLFHYDSPNQTESKNLNKPSRLPRI
jgi:hypothetical protein